MILEQIDAKLGQEDISLVMQVRMARLIKLFATVLAYLIPSIMGAAIFGLGLCSLHSSLQITCTYHLFHIGGAMALVMGYAWAVFVYLIGAFLEWRALSRLLPHARPKGGVARVRGENPVTRL